MLPDRVSNPGPLTYESGALPIALRGPARHATDLYEISFQYFQRLKSYMVNGKWEVHGRTETSKSK